MAVITPRWRSWQHLPRETRDTLFLLGVIGWISTPHLWHLPLWCTFLTIGVLTWRFMIAVTHRPLPGKLVMTLVLIVALGLTLWSFKTLLGKEAGIALVLVLLSLKTLELRARRDAFVVFFLGFFLVLTHSFYSQSIASALGMLISVLGMLTALVLAHLPVGQPQLRLAMGIALRMAALGVPVMVLLFVLFPRIGPLWGVPQDGRSSTGLSQSMRMGSVAELALDERIALRVKFLDRPPPPEWLYFRGPVFSDFDGNEWRPQAADREAVASSADTLRTIGPGVRYEVTLEPTRLPLLAMLDATPDLPALAGGTLTARRRHNLSWATYRPVTERLRITTVAYPRYVLGPVQPEPSLRADLHLPTGYNPRLLEWAAALKRQTQHAQSDATALAHAVFAHIRTAGYSYTLSPGIYGESDPQAALDEFWFDRRAGFCEHYASAFAVAMRAMGVPARIVTGYQGADPELQDGYHLVRQSYAHAWAEYWQAGQGWLRADPTAAVAPDRIERSRPLLRPPSTVDQALSTVSPHLLTQLRDLWDMMDNRWNQWVLNYAQGHQLELLKKLGVLSPRWEDLVQLLVIALAALSLVAAAWAWWGRHRQDPWQRQSHALLRALRSLGLTPATHDGPRRLASLILQRFGPEGAVLSELLLSLEHQRYGRQAAAAPSATWWQHVRAEVRSLRQGTRT